MFLQPDIQFTLALGAKDEHKIARFNDFFRLLSLLRLGNQFAAFGNQQRRISIGQRTKFFIKPDQMLFSSNQCATLFAHLEFKFVSLNDAFFVHGGQIPFVREIYARFSGAIFAAIATKYASIRSVCDFSYRGIGFEVIDHA